MAIQQKMEHEVAPPEEGNELDAYYDLYRGCDFVDDVSGQPLDKDLAVMARKLEIDVFKSMGVYTKVCRTVAERLNAKVITTRWLDVNKGDSKNPDIRCRLVGREIKKDKGRDDLFAATPPLESLNLS